MKELIPRYAEEAMRETDEQRKAARAKVDRDPNPEATFRSSFLASYADQIEMIRRGAIVTETATDEYGNEHPVAFAMPDNKPVPTVAQARRTILWSRITRPFRNAYKAVRAWIKRVFHA